MSELDELRAAFDRGFAAPATTTEERVRLLALRVGGGRFAIGFDGLSGLQQGRRVVAVRGSTPGLLGMAGVRGRVVPVFSLAALLGATDEHPSARWLLLCGGDEPIGLAFDELDGYREVPRSAVRHAGDAVGSPHVRDVARVDGAALPVISVSSILSQVRRRAEPAHKLNKES